MQLFDNLLRSDTALPPICLPALRLQDESVKFCLKEFSEAYPIRSEVLVNTYTAYYASYIISVS